MFSTPSQQQSYTHASAAIGQQSENFPPLLFSLTPHHDAQPGTPRSTSRMGGPQESSRLSSTQRRSGTPASQMDATPAPPPPPVMRLTDDVVMEDHPSTSARAGRPSPFPQPSPSHRAPAMPYGAPAQPGGLMPIEPPMQYEDVWVTVYGFSLADVPLILREFAQCGDILQWGTFGQPQANFLHIQFQTKYAAQRALLRNGELLGPCLIIGVKALDPRHRGAIEGYDAAHGSPTQVVRPRAAPDRPYRVEWGAQAQQVPQPSRSMLAKVAQYVFGV